MSAFDVLSAAATLAADGSASAAAAAIDALPWLTDALADDRARNRFDRWGASSAIDENTGAAVLPTSLFDELHARAGLTAAWPIGNAGLLHCYGYLLSLAPTPYGLKRERWLGADLARACRLADDAFLPWTPGPTLLARATEAAEGIRRAAAIVRAQVVDGRSTELALRDAQGPTALLYAAAPAPRRAMLLVTLFPVADAAAMEDQFTAEQRLRWNAV